MRRRKALPFGTELASIGTMLAALGSTAEAVS
jgi:hypothetical protein